jgi:hypothetical protein
MVHTMRLRRTIREFTYEFKDLRDLLAKAGPYRSGDALAGIAAESGEQRAAAQMTLADLPLRTFLDEALIPYETDEVTRLIVDSHDPVAFRPVASLNVGDFRNWLLSDAVTGEVLAGVTPGLTPEMVAAVSKLMRVQDLILVARKIRVITRFRTTVGLEGRLSTRLQRLRKNAPFKGLFGWCVLVIVRKHARSRSEAGFYVQLRDDGASDTVGSSGAENTMAGGQSPWADGCFAGSDVCLERSSIDCARASSAGAAFDGSVFDSVGASADGATGL